MLTITGFDSSNAYEAATEQLKVNQSSLYARTNTTPMDIFKKLLLGILCLS